MANDIGSVMTYGALSIDDLPQEAVKRSPVPKPNTRQPGISSREQQENDRARRRFRLRQTALHGFGGLVFGYVILHPVAMVVFAWFGGNGHSGGRAGILEQVADSFSLAMLPMGLVFGLFGLVLGALNGYYQSVVGSQRNELALELQLKEIYRIGLEQTIEALEHRNHRLRELELGKKQMTRFLLHEFKGHLSCVVGYSDMLLTRSPGKRWDQQDIEDLQLVRRQASRVAGSLNDLLDIARLKEIPDITTTLVSVQTLLDEALEIVAAPPGQVSIRVDSATDPRLEVCCDAELIARVISNLILNAAKHNRAAIVVTIGARQIDAMVDFACADTGQGVPAALVDRLFDEFSTSGAADDGSQSHGLGLAFCKAAVTAHGGCVWLDLEAAQGATFKFTIPAGGRPDDH